jgi:hypothetical protein
LNRISCCGCAAWACTTRRRHGCLEVTPAVVETSRLLCRNNSGDIVEAAGAIAARPIFNSHPLRSAGSSPLPRRGRPFSVAWAACWRQRPFRQVALQQPPWYSRRADATSPITAPTAAAALPLAAAPAPPDAAAAESGQEGEDYARADAAASTGRRWTAVARVAAAAAACDPVAKKVKQGTQ